MNLVRHVDQWCDWKLADQAVTLTEGWTPLLEVERDVFVKDEARNPGIFSCSSRRAAQKALERQARG